MTLCRCPGMGGGPTKGCFSCFPTSWFMRNLSYWRAETIIRISAPVYCPCSTARWWGCSATAKVKGRCSRWVVCVKPEERWKLSRPPRIPRCKNENTTLRRCKFHNKKLNICTQKSKILWSENENFALKNRSKHTAQNSCSENANVVLKKTTKFYAQKMQMLHSKTAVVLQTDHLEFCAQ